MALAFAIPVALAGEKIVTISRNEGIYDDGTGVYYCTKDGITMTFSSGLNNVNYLVEHQQVVFDIFSTNYVIKKIKFNCLDNTTDDNLDCFYWGPSTISEFSGAPYTPTGSYSYSGYVGTWVGGTTPSKYVKFVTEGKPVRFGSVEITYDKEFGDIYDLVTQSSEIQDGQTYALVSQRDSRALGKEEYHSGDPYTTYSSTPVTLLNNNQKVKVTDEVQLMKLQAAGNSSRPWYIKVGDNYMRRRSGTMSGSGTNQGFNLYSVSSYTGYEDYFRVSISFGNNSNALIRFNHTNSETAGGKTFAIRHYNGGDLFRVIDYSSNNSDATYQRVYLYKPAQSFEVTTACNPSNGGYITLGGGVLTDDQGRNWSQHYDNVTFFVGATDGYGIDEVTVTNLTTGEVTVLQPTNTSDFGNDYSFEMPEANVAVVANFVEPHVIHTVNTPDEGGNFNFVNGYTDFNGETMSNEGKTVTFTVVPSDGYMLNSITYTDNVTGQSTTMTPDGDGVYSFVMPGNDVTLTADYQAAHDLYLLGTANGRTGWVPYGPKFIFDGQNEEYYLDVYFKGGNDDAYTDPAYGYFSLTKKIDEGGNWGNISGYRLAAENNNYWVDDGYTNVPLYGDRPDNAFKIPPGVYRIKVNKDMNRISIVEYPLSLTFDPVSGTAVTSGTEVTITSNLDELVHNINPNEVDATFRNTVNNWASEEYDNTAEITAVGQTTVKAEASIGYIKVPGEAVYEIPSNLYLLGTANGQTGWHPYGPQFTFDYENDEYYIDVYFKGGNDDPNTNPAYGYFSLTTVIDQGGNWDAISPYRLAAQTDDYQVRDGDTGISLYGDRPNNAFMIQPGVYRITVNRAKTEMSITEYPLSLTFDPVSSTTVTAGTEVTVSSNLNDLVHAINPNEVNASFRNSTDGGATWDNDNTATITEVGETTVTAEANIGYIVVPGEAVYTIPAPEVYDISTVVTPEGAGEITVAEGSVAGATVTFTVTTNEGYVLDNVDVCFSNGAIIPHTDNGDGTYSFVMPDNNVIIYADYLQVYGITTVCNPPTGGTITLTGDAADGYELSGQTVVVNVDPNPGYTVASVTVTVDGTSQTVDVTDNGDGTYSFVMPEGSVTVTANFTSGYRVTCIIEPETSTGYIVSSSTSDFDVPEVQFETGSQVNIKAHQYVGYVLDHVTAVNEDTQETITVVSDGIDNTGSANDYYWHFEMPAANVTVTAVFVPYTPLSLIEHDIWGNVEGDDVIVMDTLIVTWAAKDYLWAKDMVESNHYVAQPDGTRDYVTTDMKLQHHEWDQSNWVILDCSALYPDLSTVERRERLNEYVDHKIVPSTIRGIYHVGGDELKAGHTIELSDEYRPEIVPYRGSNDVAGSLGYPGYLQDPREENQDYDYSYNHFVPANFLGNYLNGDDPWNYVIGMGENHLTSLTEPINFFFIPPKDKEVAQVWAVYLGCSSVTDGESSCDYFTTYEPYQGEGVSQNVFDLPGHFYVKSEDWSYNRLRPDLTDDAYGRPYNIDGYEYPLHVGDAYLFHVAIEHNPSGMSLKAAEPNTPKEPTDGNSMYRVMPLDMDSHEHTYTSVKTIPAPDASEIVGISYFNVMGQESNVPFDGINIMVFRYKDGSIRSIKVLK